MYGAQFATVLRKVFPKGSTFDVLPYTGGSATLCSWTVENRNSVFFSIHLQTGRITEPSLMIKGANISALVGGLDKYYVAMMATKKSG